MIAGNAILTDLNQFDVPWQDLDISDELDVGYYWHSARKLISPLLSDILGARLQSDFTSGLTTEQRTKIAGTVYVMFHRKWVKLWELYNLNYNPIANYYLSESETTVEDGEGTQRDTGTQTHVSDTDTTNTGTDTIVTDSTVTNTGTDTHAISKNESDGGSESRIVDRDTTNTGTDTTVRDVDGTDTGTIVDDQSSTGENGIFGFNSDTSVGANTNSGTFDGTRTNNLAHTEDTTNTETLNLAGTEDVTDTHTRQLTHTATNSDTETKNLTTDEDATKTETQNLASTIDTTNTRTDNLTRTTEENTTINRILNKTGNAGFNTPQEMLLADIELWQWNFFKGVFEDIDTVLALPVY